MVPEQPIHKSIALVGPVAHQFIWSIYTSPFDL